VRDLQAGTTTLASIDPSGNRLNNIVGALISADGKSVVFNRLGANAGSELYVRNLETGVTNLVLNGGAGSSPVLVAPSISANGRFISYVNIGYLNNSPLLILYVYDSQSQTTNQIATAPIPGGSLKGDSISDDGRYVSYISNSGAFVLDRGDSFGNIPITGGAEIALLNGDFPNNQAPVVTQQIVSQSIVKGNVFNISVANNFADPDAGEVLSYTAKLANGDPLPAWLGFNPKNGSFSGTPGDGDAANLSVVVRAIDKGGFRAPITFNLDVTNGNFNAPITSPGVANVGNVIVGDFNGDGKADLATIPVVNFAAYKGSPKISILLGNGSGSFGAATEYAVGSPYVAQPETFAIPPVAIAGGDFNGDGKTDLVTLNMVSQTTNASLLLANNSGGLDPQINVLTGARNEFDSNLQQAIFTGDFNNDQKQDILITNATPAKETATVLLGNGSGGFSTPISSKINSITAPFIGDFNNDGNLDYAAYFNPGSAGVGVSISLGKGDGSFNSPINSPVTDGHVGSLAGMVNGDFNGDGKLDIVFLSGINSFSQIGANILAILGDGTGHFGTPVITSNLPQPKQSVPLITGDFNGDGKLDLASTESYPTNQSLLTRRFLVYEGLGNGQFESGVSYSVSDGASGLVSGDFNGDGKLDAVGVGTMSTTVLLNNGSNSTTNSVAGINFGPDGIVGVNGLGYLVPATQNAANLDFDATGILGMFDADAGQNKFNTTVTPKLGTVGNLTITPEGAFTYHLDGSKTKALPGGAIGAAFTVTSFDGTASRDIVVRILGKNDAPELVRPIADRSFRPGTRLEFSVAQDLVDPDSGDTLDYTAIQPGSQPLPNWLFFNRTTGIFSGTPAAGDLGDFDIVVKAVDRAGLAASDTFKLTISDSANGAPVVTNYLGTKPITEGNAFSFTFPADTFSDPGDVLTYSAKLSNGQKLPNWLTFDATTRTFSGTPTTANRGEIYVNLVATDAGGLTALNPVTFYVQPSANFAPVVANAITAQSIVAGTALNFAFAANTFTDANAGDVLTYTAKLANGNSLPLWLVFNATTRTFIGTPTVNDVGNLSIALTAKDPTGLTVSTNFSLNINDTSNPTNHAPLVVTPITSRSLTVGTATNFVASAFSDPDAGDVLTYSAKLTNGNDLPTWLAFDAATRTFSGTPTAGDAGILSINFIATDRAGLQGSSNFSLNITETVLDVDGITDEIENLAPNSGDGNLDGILDRLQGNVASLLIPGGVGSSDIATLVTEVGVLLANVQLLNNPSPTDIPAEVTFPTGFADFTLTGLANGAATTVEYLIPISKQNQTYNTYWKYGKTATNTTDHWYEFLYDGQTGARFLDSNNDGKSDKILLSFVDGQRGDDDLTANGTVKDPGTPGLSSTPVTLVTGTDGVLKINGIGAALAKFSVAAKTTKRTSEIGVFKIDANNAVNGIAPTASGFAATALQKSQVIFSILGDDLLNTADISRKLQVGTGDQLGFFLVNNGTVDEAIQKNNFSNVVFSIDQANANGSKYLQTTTSDNGMITLNWEQGGDQSFNDVVINLQLDTAPSTNQNLVATLQGQKEGEVVDFRNFGGKTIKADFVVKREAAYNNTIGFYKIDDAAGTITSITGAKLAPGQAGYSAAVIQNRIAGIDLAVGNGQTATINKTIAGGEIYAPFLIANGNAGTLNGNFDNVYTLYSLGNSDKTDHIRLLGDNTFGFEDLAGGGDRDFNDVIVKATFVV
jgi:VCBS repeat-containing protein